MNKEYVYYIIMFFYIISMWIKINNDKYWAKSVTKERGAYSNELMGWVRCTIGPCCTVPFNVYIRPGIQIAFVDAEKDIYGNGDEFEETIHIRDEIILMKVIDRLDNETTLEKLEVL